MRNNHNNTLLTTALFALSLAAAPSLAQPTKPSQPKQPDFKEPASPRKSPKKPAEITPDDDDKPEKGQVDLRPKFHKNERIQYKMVMDSKSSTSNPTLEEAPNEQNTKHELALVFFVKDVTEDGTIVELTFSNVKVVQESGAGKDKEKLDFDSSSPKAKDKSNPLAPGCRELANTTFTLTLDKDGNVTNMAGGSGLSSLGAMGMPGGLGQGIPGVGAGPSHPATGSNNGFADAIGSIFSVKKGSPIVKVGEKWTTSDKVESGLIGSFQITTDSTLKSHSGNQAKIKVVGRIEPSSNSPTEASIFKIKDTFYMGDYVWDTKVGMLKTLDLDQNVTIDAGGFAGGMTMKSSSRINVNRLH